MPIALTFHRCHDRNLLRCICLFFHGLPTPRSVASRTPAPVQVPRPEVLQTWAKIGLEVNDPGDGHVFSVFQLEDVNRCGERRKTGPGLSPVCAMKAEADTSRLPGVLRIGSILRLYGPGSPGLWFGPETLRKVLVEGQSITIQAPARETKSQSLCFYT